MSHSFASSKPKIRVPVQSASDMGPLLRCILPTFCSILTWWECSPRGAVVKNSPAKVGNARHTGSVPRSGRSTRGGYGNPLQHPCLENSMGRGAWQVTHEVTKNWTQLSPNTHGERNEGIHGVLLTKNPPPSSNHFTNFLLPNTITLDIRISTYEFWGNMVSDHSA